MLPWAPSLPLPINKTLTLGHWNDCADQLLLRTGTFALSISEYFLTKSTTEHARSHTPSWPVTDVFQTSHHLCFPGSVVCSKAIAHLCSSTSPPTCLLVPAELCVPFQAWMIKKGGKEDRERQKPHSFSFSITLPLYSVCVVVRLCVWGVCAYACVCVMVGIFIQASMACGYWLVVWVLVESEGEGGGTPWLPHCHRHTGTTEPVQVPLSKIRNHRSLCVCVCVCQPSWDLVIARVAFSISVLQWWAFSQILYNYMCFACRISQAKKKNNSSASISLFFLSKIFTLYFKKYCFHSELQSQACICSKERKFRSWWQWVLIFR